MYLAALNGHVASESRSDRLGKSLRAVDDEKARQGGIEAALDALAGIAVDVISLFMALLSSRGISTPGLQAQGEQRRSSYFNNHRDITL